MRGGPNARIRGVSLLEGPGLRPQTPIEFMGREHDLLFRRFLHLDAREATHLFGAGQPGGRGRDVSGRAAGRPARREELRDLGIFLISGHADVSTSGGCALQALRGGGSR